MFQILFEDGSQLTVRRSDIWLLNEELPRKVKARVVSGVQNSYETRVSSTLNLLRRQ